VKRRPLIEEFCIKPNKNINNSTLRSCSPLPSSATNKKYPYLESKTLPSLLSHPVRDYSKPAK